ncbi:hypothetical protein [Streptomyces sp. NPDC048332]
MARLIPLILIALGVYFWLRARKRADSFAETFRPEDGTPRR